MTSTHEPVGPLGGRLLCILGYHRVGPAEPGGWETWFSVPTDTFRTHLETIDGSAWEVLDLQTVADALGDWSALPPRSLLITFDDGYVSVLQHAVPLMQEYRLPGVMFVPTDHVGRTNDFDPGEPPGRLCTWSELAELESANVAVQSHAASHEAFSTLTLDVQSEQLRRSKQAIQAHLDRPVSLFAYPFGDIGTQNDALVEAARRLGYRGACRYPGAVNALPTDPFHLQRIAMGPDTDLAAVLEGQVS